VALSAVVKPVDFGNKLPGLLLIFFFFFFGARAQTVRDLTC
jgi:hypothetical protein